ncbi:MAG: response regulator [Verrucomicrobiota bacterium]|jgi:CheY-like chemotaxis protein
MIPSLVENVSLVSAKTILLVDDQDGNRIMTKWFLNNFGYTVESSRSAEEALLLFDPKVHDLIVTDNSMPGMTGAEMAHIIKLRSPTTPVVMFTGAPPADRSCLDVVLQRPMHLMRLKEAVDRILSGSAPSALSKEESDLHSNLL